jgi:N-methylhydantoinase B
VWRADGRRETVSGRTIFRKTSGDRVIGLTGGGGGFGDPLQRSPEQVADDVREGETSPRAAQDRCGVVIGADGNVDQGTTVRLRASMTPRSVDIDRGVHSFALEFADDT